MAVGAPEAYVPKADAIESERARVVKAIQEANQEPDAIKRSAKKKNILQGVLSYFSRTSSQAQRLREKLIEAHTKRQSVSIDPREVENINVSLTTLLQVIQQQGSFDQNTWNSTIQNMRAAGEDPTIIENIPQLDEPTRKVLTRISQSKMPNDLALFYFDLVSRFTDANKKLKVEFSAPNNPPTPFEQYFQDLKLNNRDVAKTLAYFITDTATANGDQLAGVTKDVIKEKLAVPDEPVETNANRRSPQEVSPEVVSLRHRMNEVSKDIKNKVLSLPGATAARIMNLPEAKAVQLLPNLADDVNTFLYYGGDIAALKYSEQFTEGSLIRDLQDQIDLSQPNEMWSRYIEPTLRAIYPDQQQRQEILRGATELQEKDRTMDNTFMGLEGAERLAEILAKIDNDEKILRLLFHPVTDASGAIVNYKWNDAGARQLQNFSRSFIGILFEKFDNMGSFDEGGWSQMYEERALATLSARLKAIERSETIHKTLSGNRQLLDQFTQFMRDNLGRGVHKEKKMRFLLLQMPEVAEHAKVEEIAGKFAGYNVSEFALITSDPLVNRTMKRIKQYVQMRCQLNGNVIPSNLFKGQQSQSDKLYNQRYYNPDREAVFDLLKKECMELGEEREDFEIFRSISLALGLLIIDGELGGVLANTRVPTNYKDIPFAQLVRNRNIMMGWPDQGGIRGGDNLKEPWMFMAQIQRKEVQDGLLNRLEHMWKHRAIPKEQLAAGQAWAKRIKTLQDQEIVLSEEQTAAFYSEFIDWMETYAEDDFWFEVLRDVGIGGFVDRGGWRIEGLKTVYQKDTGKSASHTDADFYKWLRRHGVTYQFLVIDDLGKDQAEKYLGKVLGPKKNKALYQTGMNRFDTVISVNQEVEDQRGRVDKTDTKLTYTEYLARRQNALRGETWYHLFLKDPLGFLGDFGQLIPEITSGTVGNKSAAEYYLGDLDADDTSGKKLDLKSTLDDRTKVMNVVLRQMGGHNVRHVKFIMDFYTQLYKEMQKVHPDTGKQKDAAGNEIKPKRDVKQVTFNAMMVHMSAARERMKKRVDASFAKDPNSQIVPELTPDDVMSDEIEKHLLELAAEAEKDKPNQPGKKGEIDRVKKEIEEAKLIKKMLFEGSGGKDGLIKYFKNYVGDEKKHFGDGEKEMGRRKGFFHQVDKLWKKRAPKTLPPGDENTHLLLQRADVAGEKAFNRNWGDSATIDDIQNAVGKLNGVVKKIGLMPRTTEVSKALDGVFEVHGKVAPFISIESKEYMFQKQYEVASVVISGLREHWSTRLPFLFGPLFRIGRIWAGRSISITNLRPWGRDHDAFTLSSDGIRWYASELARRGLIPETGKWSAEMLMKSFDVDDAPFWMEVGSHMSLIGLGSGVWSLVKKAAQAELKKGK